MSDAIPARPAEASNRDRAERMVDRARERRRRGHALRAPVAGAGGMLFLIALVASAQAASVIGTVPPFHGAAWSASSTKDSTGCTTGTNDKAHWSKATGIGTLYATGHSRTCRGQSRTYGSSGTVSSGLQISIPVRPTGSSTGMNVSWTIAATLSTSGGVLGSTACAPTRANVSYNLGYTWENYSSISYACYGLGSVAIGGSTELEDVTTGAVTGSNNSWAGVENFSGLENYSFADRYSYSNSSYWGYNTSYSYTFNQSYGPRGSLVGLWTPTWYLNGSYVPMDQYLILTSITLTVYTDAFGYHRAYGGGTGDLLNGANHADLTRIAVW